MKMKSLLLVTLAMLGLTTSTMAQNLPNYVPANGLVGWWPFNGNANDESGNGNNGTVIGPTLTTDRFGMSNSAYNFSSNIIDVGSNNTLNIGPNGISVSAWFNNIGGDAWHILGKRTECGAFYYQMSSNNLPYGLAWGGLTQGENSFVQSGLLSTSNQWNNIIGTFDGTEWKLYLNSILLDSLTSPVTDIVNTNLIFGNSGTCEYFEGKIDDIGIWNRPLNHQEITDLYNGNICYQTISVTDTLLINMGITGFNPVTFNNTIKIFPNPANNHITIDYGNFATMNGYQLKIENSLGQQLFQTNITQQTDYLSLNNWGGNGLYFVHVIDAQGNTIDIRKIVLQ